MTTNTNQVHLNMTLVTRTLVPQKTSLEVCNEPQSFYVNDPRTSAVARERYERDSNTDPLPCSRSTLAAELSGQLRADISGLVKERTIQCNVKELE